MWSVSLEVEQWEVQWEVLSLTNGLKKNATEVGLEVLELIILWCVSINMRLNL